MQSEEENSPAYLLTVAVFKLGSPKEWLVFKKQVKHVLKGQNIGDMDTAYRLVWDLLKGQALMAFTNEQATFNELTAENIN
eukprot:14138707-Ditylum_brightwellii.AAC.3